MGKPDKAPAIFLDRDGVIIVEKHFQADPSTIEFIEGSIEALKNVNENFCKVVVSNQSGVARGYFSRDDVLSFNDALDSILRNHGIVIDGWYFCVHGPDDGCDCRKPKPGQFLKAADDLPIDLHQSWIIGDKSSDVAAGASLGLKTILVLTGYAGKEPNALSFKPDFIADNLYDAVNIINEGIKV
jgi:D-glycero-D-manno-heptose 1,7-bisphosphate phosphatase